MIVKKGYTTVNALAGEWLTNYGFTGKVEEDLLKRHASLRAEEIIGTEQLQYSVALLNVENFKAQLPQGLHSIYLAAGTSHGEHFVQKEEFIGYTQKIYGTDCDVEVNILCPKCGDSVCECHSSTIDIHLDQFEMLQSPHLWMARTDKYLGFSSPQTDGFPHVGLSPHFHIIKPRKSDQALWNTEYFLGVCEKLGDVKCHTYDVEPPYFIPDFKHGQVFLAYRKYAKDSEGYFLIPDYPIVIRAITAYMTEMFMWREWMKNGNQSDRLRHLDAKNEANQLMAQATSELEMPSPETIMNAYAKHWHQDRSRFHYGSPR